MLGLLPQAENGVCLKKIEKIGWIDLLLFINFLFINVTIFLPRAMSFHSYDGQLIITFYIFIKKLKESLILHYINK